MLVNAKVFGVNADWLLGGALAACILAFYFTRNPVFSMAGFAAILLLFLFDAAPCKWDAKGVKSSLLELVGAVALAAGAWFVLQFVLSTAAPLDVVTSCSMLPVLERGDFIVVAGREVAAPTVFVDGPVEAALQGATLQKAACTLALKGEQFERACTTGVTVVGKFFAANSSNDVIVFDATPRAYGLVVHRAFLRVVNGTHEFFLTKGDNNLGLDQEAGIGIVPRADVHGAVVMRAPLAGFLKLFLFMQFDEPEGCKVLVTGGN